MSETDELRGLLELPMAMLPQITSCPGYAYTANISIFAIFALVTIHSPVDRFRVMYSTHQEDGARNSCMRV